MADVFSGPGIGKCISHSYQPLVLILRVRVICQHLTRIHGLIYSRYHPETIRDTPNGSSPSFDRSYDKSRWHLPTSQRPVYRGGPTPLVSGSFTPPVSSVTYLSMDRTCGRSRLSTS